MSSLRARALAIVVEREPSAKCALCESIDWSWPADAQAQWPTPPDLPGRPARPEWVPHQQVPQRPVGTPEGRAALIHALAHIEFNAINLAADICWRFPGMPDEFYRGWLGVAQEEAQHFSLLRAHLRSLGHDYGDFPAHGALWEMAERTQHSLLARVALVPRTLEARGLDASPAVKAKLVAVGDQRAGEILDIILRDEVGHVALGNRWYAWLCQRDGLDPVHTYRELARTHRAPKLRGPFNLSARRAAGFTEAELAELSA